jgi:hypothetical protein
MWRGTQRRGLPPPGWEALVYEVVRTTAFGFGKGDVNSQTRWRFQPR